MSKTETKHILSGALLVGLIAIPAYSADIVAIDRSGTQVMLGSVPNNGDTELSVAGKNLTAFGPLKFAALFPPPAGMVPCEIYNESTDTPIEFQPGWTGSSIRVTTTSRAFGGIGNEAVTCNIILHKMTPEDAMRPHPMS